MSIGQYILIDPNDCPSRQELKDTIIRLYKDAELLTRMRCKKDVDPISLRHTAQFLERIYVDNRLKQELANTDDEEKALKDIEKSKIPKVF